MNEIELTNQSAVILAESIGLFEIKCQDDFNIANEYLQRNKAQQKKVLEYFDPVIADANRVHKTLTKKKSDMLKPLMADYDQVSAACSSFVSEQKRLAEAETKRLEAEAAAQAERDKATIIAVAEKEEAAGDIQTASDLLEQAADLVPAEVKPVQVITGVKSLAGSTKWQDVLEVTIDKASTIEIAEAVCRGELPIECIEIKDGPIKRYFERQGIKEYNKYGIVANTVSKPRTWTPGARND